MSYPRFTLNDIVTISPEVEDWKGYRCQIKDYNTGDDEYYLLIIEGDHKNQYLWVKAKYVCDWDHYCLIRTIDNKKYQEYMQQLEHADSIRNDIFKNIYSQDKKAVSIDEFYEGRRVSVYYRAGIRDIWEHWTPSMDATRGLSGTVTSVDRKYNSVTNEYERVICVEFAFAGFSHFTYSFLYLPQHLEITN